MYSTPGRLSNLVFAISSLPARANKFLKIRRAVSRKSHWVTQRAIAIYHCCVTPSKSSRDSCTLVSNQSYTHFSRRSRRAFETGSRPQTRSRCWHRLSRISLRRGRPELCLSISQQHTTLYGTMASPASCCDCCLIDAWSAWSWRLLATAALHLPPETVKGAGYDGSRTSSHRDLPWRPFSSTSTCDLPTTVSRKYAFSDCREQLRCATCKPQAVPSYNKIAAKA